MSVYLFFPKRYKYIIIIMNYQGQAWSEGRDTAKILQSLPSTYALQPAVEDEYNRLEAEDVIEKVEFSYWATPMVHIPKADRTTRSCGDYAVTVNPQLNIPITQLHFRRTFSRNL